MTSNPIDFLHNWSEETALSVYSRAQLDRENRWVPAAGGYEQPALVEGVVYLYVYNFARDEHAWLNMLTDVVERDCPWTEDDDDDVPPEMRVTEAEMAHYAQMQAEDTSEQETCSCSNVSDPSCPVH